MAENETAAAAPAPTKKRKKLTKDLTTKPGVVMITVEGGDLGRMEFPFKSLPENIQEQFGPFGLGHKLGDAAAGREGKDAEEAINKVWDGLSKGDWTIRAPAKPKIDLTEVATKMEGLSGKEKAAAQAILAKLGVNLPS